MGSFVVSCTAVLLDSTHRAATNTAEPAENGNDQDNRANAVASED
jgi:hypothetical protein